MASRSGFLASAYAAARQAGLPDVAARVAASQAALESGYGKSAPGNNFYGIKAGPSWTGAVQRLATKEMIGGKLVSVMADFRAYATPQESFRDWANLIGRRFPGVLTAPTFKEAVSALKAGQQGGYATDKFYASKLNAINGRIDPSVASLPETMPAPPSKFRDIPSVPVAPTPQNIQSAMRLANIDNAQYSAPLGEAIGRAPLGNIPSVPSRPTSPTPPSALASWDAPKPSPSFGLGLVTPAAATTLSPQDMRNAVNLGALPAGGALPGAATAVGQPPSFSSPMMMAAAPAAPTQTFSPPSVPAMPSRPVTPTPPAALAAMNSPDVPSSLMAPDALGPLASLAPPDAVQPTFTPAEAISPAVPSVPNVVNAPAARPSVPAARPATPTMASAADVYGGKANIGRATDGNIVSRDALGRMSVTNKFGATTTTLPGGWASVSYGGVPSAPSVPSAAPSVPGIAGPLGQGSIPSTPSTGLFGISPAQTETGNLARGIAGAMTGSAVGSLAGPIGSMIGAALGKSIAQGKNPLDGLLGKNVSFNTQALGLIKAAAPVSGLAFPTAPTRVGALGGTQSNRSMEGMRGISPGAAAAIGRGQGGLY